MSDLITKIGSEIKDAMRAKEKAKLSALRYMKSMLLENKTAKKPIAELDVIVKHSKKLKDSVEVYPEGSEQRTNILQEIEYVAAYLPAQLNSENVESLIKEIIGGNESPNFGMVMKELSPKIKGQFDGKMATELVKKIIGA
jgi:uncharacterized protein